jgi:hypothetical protein
VLESNTILACFKHASLHRGGEPHIHNNSLQYDLNHSLYLLILLSCLLSIYTLLHEQRHEAFLVTIDIKHYRHQATERWHMHWGTRTS